MSIAFVVNIMRSLQKDSIAYGVIIAKKVRLNSIVLTLKTANRTLTAVSALSETASRQC